MTGQHEPDPNNRFETWADGTTPASGRPASGDAPAEPPTWTPPTSASSAADSPSRTPHTDDPAQQPASSGQSFPTYPYSANETYADPHQDEAYSAFQGYQASTQGYPHQVMQPHQAYQGPYSMGPAGYPGPAPNAPYAVPSLVLGIISIFCGGVTGPIGLGLGVAALKQIEASPRALAGRGLAIAGIATSALGTFFLLLVILGVLAG